MVLVPVDITAGTGDRNTPDITPPQTILAANLQLFFRITALLPTLFLLRWQSDPCASPHNQHLITSQSAPDYIAIGTWLHNNQVPITSRKTTEHKRIYIKIRYIVDTYQEKLYVEYLLTGKFCQTKRIVVILQRESIVGILCAYMKTDKKPV